MITQVVMPQMGLEVSEGTVSTIHVGVGERVARGEPLMEMETDKALTDIVASTDGVVSAIEVQVGDTVAVGATLVVLRDDSAPVDATASSASAGETVDPRAASDAPPPAAEATVRSAPAPAGGAAEARAAVPTTALSAPAESRVRAAPVARRAAEKLGVALGDVTGTGPRGRITLRDVQRLAPPGANGSEHPAASERLEPLSVPRRAVARRMTLSQQIPQFALVREIDAGWLLSEKDRLREQIGTRVGVNDLLMQALAETLRRHPDLAAAYVPGEDGGAAQLRRQHGIDVGLAVAGDRGLLVPVIRRVGECGLRDIVAERARLVAAARSGRLAVEEMTGATVTISSLASFGVDHFTAMINPGETAILAVGRLVERVVARDRGLVVIPTVTLSLTLDHRVVDGAMGAAALAELVGLLEGGMTWRP